MLYVVKDGKPIYADKTLVGTIGYATPVFTADMETIVFNPDWIAPETVVTENLLPPLREGNYSILKVHKLSVSYNGSPVDPARVNWGRGNILELHLPAKGRAAKRPRQGEIPIPQPAHRLHARHAPRAEEILQGADAHDRA